MPKLLYGPTSPYSAKVRMAAELAGIALETQVVDTSADPSLLIDANPLGKIPTLITEDGVTVYDSRVITQYLNRLSGNKIFPRNAAKRLEAETLEALADGICDCLLTIVYERRMRPEEKVHQPWVDRQWEKALRGLDALNTNPPKLPKSISVGQIAVRSLIAYLDIRFAGKWEKGRGKLKRWAVRFDEKWPDLAAKTPKA
ncbi:MULTISPECIES: glutathione S-transferase family protein [Mesorhizobium]|uniref:Glutathione S-transferase family protein n=1 Tax=Mesorhizobium denitrificans TaxID=2294114 RepID=A0A371XJ44_9HYPH|nr:MULTISPECIES: glutathione S-transferase family protein [Mesorhizobium]RFC69084.1 glutathione S-transferase family protein [Mesorhizobium denitrificans]